jgi:hypothetical protein
VSLNRDPLIIGIFAILLTVLVAGLGVDDTALQELSSENVVVGVLLLHFDWALRVLAGLDESSGWLAVLPVSYLIILGLYIISWIVNEAGRRFIQAWGRAGGPGLGLFSTWIHCVPSAIVYMIGWWICPLNHRTITNAAYNLNLMRLRFLAIPLIVAVWLIPGAQFSGHYRDVFGKIMRNYPWAAYS